MLFSMLRSKWLTTLWFVMMNVLFFLPGSDLPQHGWFEAIPQFDKLVHFSLFAVLIFQVILSFRIKLPASGWIVLLTAMVYGFLVECIQLKWVPNRSFDMLDVAADTAGSIAGLILSWALYKKNKPL